MSIRQFFKRKYKHYLHLAALTAVVCYTAMAIKYLQRYKSDNPWEEYGIFLTFFIYFSRLTTILPFPQTLCNVMGLICFNVFPEDVKLKQSAQQSPFLCFRVVTRGDFPDLIKKNVMRNINTCLDLGLENFVIEVTTDKPIHLAKHNLVRETVVPRSYRTTTGALFKARALQYCLEEGVNVLKDDEWIVHLDEETLLTANSVSGIVNFVCDGRYEFGQGLITYASENVVNWLTTIADMSRVADDMGKLRFQLKVFHRPIFSWKGSYVVCKAGAERSVSYDHGPDGSVAEDCYFAMVAMEKGYTFDFIEGEMHERSPFTIMDFIKQRKRWFQGIWLVAVSKNIPFRIKYFISIGTAAWCFMPLSIFSFLIIHFYPVPYSPLMNALYIFLGAFFPYTYMFGIVKSVNHKRIGYFKTFLLIMLVPLVLPVIGILENIGVLWGMFSPKHNFHVISKDPDQQHLEQSAPDDKQPLIQMQETV